MLERFYPDAYIASAYDVDYGELYRRGFRAVGFDIDNTLVLHDAPANKAAVQLFEKIHRTGFRICLISNNHLKRVALFAEAAGADLYLHDAHKPSPQAYRKATRLLGIRRKRLVFLGDQLFTDIWGAKNAGIAAVLVKPLGGEKLLRIKLKRLLERPILRSFLRTHPMGMGGLVPHSTE